MAAYSMTGTKEKSPKRQEVEARQHVTWTCQVVQKPCWPGGPQLQASMQADHLLG